MKKILCLFTAIITIMSFAACGNGDIESGSMGQEISKTEISRQNEQPSENESSFAEVSEPVSEEISEPVSEEVSRKDPEQHIDPEDFPYRRFSAHSAAELVNKLKEANEKINGDKASDFNMKDIDYLAPLSGILAQGFIFNPSVDGIYAENDPNSVYGKIEMIFDRDGMVTIIYYCRNDNDVWARVQINYPEEKAGQLIAKYGADGFRMYCSGSEKPLSSLTTQEIAAMEHDSVSIQNILFEGKTFEALKYVNESRGHTNTVTFLYEDVIVTINYKYRDSDANIDDILGTIKLEKLYFDGSSKDVSRDEPQPSIDPEDFPYRRFSAHSAAELVNKLKEANEKINGDKASDFNMKDIDYLAPLSGILAQGFIFNPSVDGIYAENDTSESHGKIEMVFDDNNLVTVIYYCRNDDDVWAMIQITYPNEEAKRMLTQYGPDGFSMYLHNRDVPLSQMTEAQKAEYGLTSSSVQSITIDGTEHTAVKRVNTKHGGNGITTIHYGFVVVISYKYTNQEYAATHDVDDILDTIKLEKLYFDKAE